MKDFLTILRPASGSKKHMCRCCWWELIPACNCSFYVGFAKSITMVEKSCKEDSFANKTKEGDPTGFSVNECFTSRESEESVYCNNYSGSSVVSFLDFRFFAWVLLAKPLLKWCLLYETSTHWVLFLGSSFLKGVGVVVFLLLAALLSGRKVYSIWFAENLLFAGYAGGSLMYVTAFRVCLPRSLTLLQYITSYYLFWNVRTVWCAVSLVEAHCTLVESVGRSPCNSCIIREVGWLQQGHYWGCPDA